jgi:endonuclease YncB( thermonuclease family)
MYTMPSSPIIVLICTSIMFSSLVFTILHSPEADARCPNGYHKSPSGDCEKVTHSGGLPRCPDGSHRSPDGDCEQVSSGDDSTNDDVDRREPIGETDDRNDAGSNISSSTSLATTAQIGGCKGSADCFTGIVTEIVDGDTIDVNNVRVRLSMVNTPERGEAGYNEATEITESVCPVGANALVDEDDGQKEGSYDRLIGVVYCNGSTTSLNQVLLEQGKAIVYEDFCGVSEFANDKWVTSFGC